MITQSSVTVGDLLLEIDHIFICVDAEPDPGAFARLGLICSDQVVRREQQGIASRLVFFNNVYLEFVWVEDAEQAEIYAMRSGIDYLSRAQWKVSQYCPLGVALRHCNVNDPDPDLNVFNHTSNVADGVIRLEASNLVAQWEPFCYIIPSAIALTTLFARSRTMQGQLTNHALGIQRLTHAHMSMEHEGPLTPPMSMLEKVGIVELTQNQQFELILTFDQHRQGRCLDLVSLDIPVILRY
ncbi:MAG: hypothetical protein AAGD25_00235 [Cyanobacteria bacterium P01_F01_bin.150]